MTLVINRVHLEKIDFQAAQHGALGLHSGSGICLSDGIRCRPTWRQDIVAAGHYDCLSGLAVL
jgi:hypothetical protein